MKIRYLLFTLAVCLTVQLKAQHRSAQLDSLTKIFLNVRVPLDISYAQKTIMGYVAISLTDQFKFENIVYSKSIPASVAENFNKVKKQLPTLKWQELFPGAKQWKGPVYVLVPIVIRSEPRSNEQLSSEAVADMFNAATELNQFKTAALWIAGETVIYTTGKPSH